MDELDKCPSCDGVLVFPPVENCSCHINPPCSECTSIRLTCLACGWMEEVVSVETYRALGPVCEVVTTHPSHEFGNGARIFDWDYDSRSGSSMTYHGKLKGDVSPDDIIRFFGEGTFGHRGPSFFKDGTFAYVKITD